MNLWFNLLFPNSLLNSLQIWDYDNSKKIKQMTNATKLHKRLRTVSKIIRMCANATVFSK